MPAQIYLHILCDLSELFPTERGVTQGDASEAGLAYVCWVDIGHQVAPHEGCSEVAVLAARGGA